MLNGDRLNIHRIESASEVYPALLRLIKKPPKTLYYRGDISLCNTPCLAVVGARKGTAYGKDAAYRLAKRVAELGITVVSGMALGIDSAAHQGALDAGGKTIAVLGFGMDVCYPKANKKMMDDIISKGLALSEYPPATPPLAFHFPERNRIISGLSQAVVVVEAALSSGSLITAELALEQGKEVYAVPGSINSIYSLGTNKLIQDGAAPLVVIDDVLECFPDMQFCVKDRQPYEYDRLGSDEKCILSLVSNGKEVTTVCLCKETGRSAEQISAIIAGLEMKGWVQTALGKVFIAKHR